MGKTYRKNKAGRYRWGGCLGDDNRHREDYIRDSIQKSYIRAMGNGEWVDRTEEEIKKAYDDQKEQHEKNMRQYRQDMYFYEISYKRYIENKIRAAMDKEFREKNGPFYEPRKPYEPSIYVNKSKRIPLTKTFEEYFEEHYAEVAKWYDKFYSRGKMRDGRLYETGRNKMFKDMCKHQRRTQDRKNINKIMKNDIDSEDVEWYDNRNGKKFVWAVW